MSELEDQERDERERERNQREREERGDRPADRPEDLTDELARKYDPARMLGMVSKRAGRGDSLEHSVRAKYEKRFGVDLGHVRVYTGEFAEEFNRQRNAYAVTVGATGMIMMGNSPEKSMASAQGQALLAHELTHVAQQVKGAGGGLHRKARFDDAMPFAAEHEAEAELVEQAVLAEQLGGGPQALDSKDAAAHAEAQRVAQVSLKETIEKIKARVLDLFGDAARNQSHRNGHARRA
ncbi:MAG: DUF4157 domain-containing protein [Kofleriaceae bacterium]